jgi:hypothetical protein
VVAEHADVFFGLEFLGYPGEERKLGYEFPIANRQIQTSDFILNNEVGYCFWKVNAACEEIGPRADDKARF